MCEAYHRLRTIANEAEKRMPRFNNFSGKSHTPRPRAILDVKEPTPPHEDVDEPKVVHVVRKNDNDGNEVLVDEKTNEVYSSDGSLVGHWVGGVVMDRSDASV